MKKPTKKQWILGILAVLILVQFIRIDKTAPDFDASQDFLASHNENGETGKLIKDACYDCHSYEVKYPWYTDVAPVSWWIKNHINGGVKHLNFSIWGTYSEKRKNHKLEECVEMMENKFMPLKSYTWLHPEARLSDEQNQLLIDFFKSKM